MNDIAIEQVAVLLMDKAGVGPVKRIEPLVGGGNNRVFRIFGDRGESYVLKLYYRDTIDSSRRLDSEWNFLNFVIRCGVNNVPRPVARDAARGGALYHFITGLRPTRADRDLVRQAASFVVAINRKPVDIDVLPPAKEACFSIGDHIATIDQRVLSIRDATMPVDQVRTLVETRLMAAWEKVKADIYSQAAARNVRLTCKVAEEIASPSDFGFHNALLDPDARVSFLDFEYAGRDDPAKLICDFFCQPEVPVSLAYYPEFISALTVGLELDEEDIWRAKILLDAYRVKWVCILLGRLFGAGARRRVFAAAPKSVTQQLRIADGYLDLVSSMNQ